MSYIPRCLSYTGLTSEKHSEAACRGRFLAIQQMSRLCYAMKVLLCKACHFRVVDPSVFPLLIYVHEILNDVTWFACIYIDFHPCTETILVPLLYPADMKRRRSTTKPDGGNSCSKRRRRDAKAASLLTLPCELRDQIYELVVPYGNIHIRCQLESQQACCSTCGLSTDVDGKTLTLTRKVCVLEEEKDDHVAAQEWIDGIPHPSVLDYEERHQRCLFRFPYQHAQPIWPFALLFVSRQVHSELLDSLYKRCSFSFDDTGSLKKFTARTSEAQLGLISDLRLGLSMGSSASSGCDLFHSSPQDAVTICRSFTGLRKLHASLSLRFNDVRQLRDTISTNWKIAHWARDLLNFAYHPLETVTIMLEQCDSMDRQQSDQMMMRHSPKQDELQGWARSIRAQLLAPWDRDAILAFLQRHRTQETEYHRKLCGNHVDFEPLAPPDERIP